MNTHVVIPDTQVAPGTPTDHLRWIGQYIWDQFHDRQNVYIIHLGDHWDMPSLSSYDKPGSKSMEGRRYLADVAAGNEALKLLTAPTDAYNAMRVRNHKSQWMPEKYLLRGNHEDRISRATELDPKLDGVISLDNLESPGWEVIPYLDLLWLHGVCYSHYFYQPMTGRPYSGTIDNRLRAIGHSFTMGHQQTKLTGERWVLGPDGNHKQQRGLICGACYLHDEDYKGPQGNAHWRGIIVCHQVREGGYDLMEVSLEWLCNKYEGVSLSEFLA